ncbi:MAG: adenylate/guanylate cyclase domain-containing protein [Leptospirales bacterium]|nr:adenylate/guanylate cyclase domain-containing protein [Leptospirales bacterium]
MHRLVNRARAIASAAVHVGIEANVPEHTKRPLALANTVTLLAILVTLPNIPQFLSFDAAAASQAAISASVASLVYALAYLLLALHRRRLGLTLLSYGSIANVTAITWILGTSSGAQYYFIAMGVGVMLLWPPAYRISRVVVGLVGGLAFLATMALSPEHAAFAPALPSDVERQIFFAQIAGAYGVGFGFVYYAIVTVGRVEQSLDRERSKADALLLNILPAPIAARLKESADSIAQRFEEVSVVFADLVGFTALSAAMRPEDIVELLNRVFSSFDERVRSLGLEKIKTIGDAYMAAGGAPAAMAEHRQAAAEMALYMVERVDQLARESGLPLQIRVGIHSGPVVAGVIGKDKFIYDLWGDTVNTAARMESHGEPGRIQVSAAFYESLGNTFVLERRGEIEVKGKGRMETYWLLAEGGD